MFQPVSHWSVWITGNSFTPKIGKRVRFWVQRCTPICTRASWDQSHARATWKILAPLATVWSIFSERIHMIWWSCPTFCCNVVFRRFRIYYMAAKVNPVADQKLHTPEAYLEGIPQKHTACRKTNYNFWKFMDAGWQQNTEPEETKEKETKQGQLNNHLEAWCFSMLSMFGDVCGKRNNFCSVARNSRSTSTKISIQYYPFDAP